MQKLVFQGNETLYEDWTTWEMVTGLLHGCCVRGEALSVWVR